jgi:hypothetical protein
MKTKVVKFTLVTFAFLSMLLFPNMSSADHSWGNYHWARSSNPFTLTVVDSNTSDWDDNLNKAMTDWVSRFDEETNGTIGQTVFKLKYEQGDESRNGRKRCAMISGKIRSCNAEYGFNGWLGLASINVSGGQHITQGSSKMNDSYLQQTKYSETNKQHVMCQEIGHDFGLGHTSEDGSDQNTCMDYSNDLGNPSPNAHDYALLKSKYDHTNDGGTTVAATSASKGVSEEVTDNPNSWGELMRQSANGRSSTYVKEHSNGSRTITHVFWTKDAADRCPGCDHRYHEVH